MHGPCGLRSGLWLSTALRLFSFFPAISLNYFIRFTTASHLHDRLLSPIPTDALPLFDSSVFPFAFSSAFSSLGLSETKKLPFGLSNCGLLFVCTVYMYIHYVQLQRNLLYSVVTFLFLRQRLFFSTFFLFFQSMLALLLFFSFFSQLFLSVSFPSPSLHLLHNHERFLAVVSTSHLLFTFVLRSAMGAEATEKTKFSRVPWNCHQIGPDLTNFCLFMLRTCDTGDLFPFHFLLFF